MIEDEEVEDVELEFLPIKDFEDNYKFLKIHEHTNKTPGAMAY